MSSYYEDIDEALAEYDDESDDEGLFSRRRRRRPQNRYAQQGGQRTPVSQSQLNRVGEDVQDTAPAIRKLQQDQQMFTQLSIIGPLLGKGKTVEVAMTTAGVNAKVNEASDSILPLMLPLLMMGQSSAGSTSSTQNNNNNMMMMLVMMIALSGRDAKPIL